MYLENCQNRRTDYANEFFALKSMILSVVKNLNLSNRSLPKSFQQVSAFTTTFGLKKSRHISHEFKVVKLIYKGKKFRQDSFLELL